ncbi:hypothetical protein [Candidatus Nitrosocosmicus sp. T]
MNHFFEVELNTITKEWSFGKASFDLMFKSAKRELISVPIYNEPFRPGYVGF